MINEIIFIFKKVAGFVEYSTWSLTFTKVFDGNQHGGSCTHCGGDPRESKDVTKSEPVGRYYSFFSVKERAARLPH